MMKWICSYVAYNSPDNFLSPIPVSDCLIFSYGILILHQKRDENDKKFFEWKQQKMPNKYMYT